MVVIIIMSGGSATVGRQLLLLLKPRVGGSEGTDGADGGSGTANMEPSTLRGLTEEDAALDDAWSVMCEPGVMVCARRMVGFGGAAITMSVS